MALQGVGAGSGDVDLVEQLQLFGGQLGEPGHGTQPEAHAVQLDGLQPLQGAGDVLPPMLISLGTSFLFTIPVSAHLVRNTDLGATGIWIAFLASSVISTLATGLWLATGRWARRTPHSPLPPEPE